MNLWKIERTDPVHYDETAGAVIAAETEQRARKIAHDELVGDQDPNVWFAPTTEVTWIGVALPEMGSGIILTDFRAG